MCTVKKLKTVVARFALAKAQRLLTIMILTCSDLTYFLYFTLISCPYLFLMYFQLILFSRGQSWRGIGVLMKWKSCKPLSKIDFPCSTCCHWSESQFGCILPLNLFVLFLDLSVTVCVVCSVSECIFRVRYSLCVCQIWCMPNLRYVLFAAVKIKSFLMYVD